MRAFTLIELLIVILIFSFIMAVILGILHVSNLNLDSTLGMLQLTQEVRLVMDGMTREVRQSSYNQATVSNAGSKLDFYIPNITPIISYYVQNNQLIREHSPGNKKVLANNISQATFVANSSILQINITAAKTTIRNIPLSFSSMQQVKWRN